MNFPQFADLKTKRLVLRRIRHEDAEEIFQLRSDEKVSALVDRPVAISIDDARQFINKIISAQVSKEGIFWVITLKDDPTLIGTILYWNIDKVKDQAEVGYELLPQYHGQGIMYEALLKIIEFGFNSAGIKTIVADPKAINERSVNLLEKCGFTKKAISNDGYVLYELNKPYDIPNDNQG